MNTSVSSYSYTSKNVDPNERTGLLRLNAASNKKDVNTERRNHVARNDPSSSRNSARKRSRSVSSNISDISISSRSSSSSSSRRGARSSESSTGSKRSTQSRSSRRSRILYEPSLISSKGRNETLLDSSRERRNGSEYSHPAWVYYPDRHETYYSVLDPPPPHDFYTSKPSSPRKSNSSSRRPGTIYLRCEGRQISGENKYRLECERDKH